MKVREPSLGEVTPLSKARTARVQPDPSSPSSRTSATRALVDTARTEAQAAHQRDLRAIKASVQAGTYRPDPQRITGAMLDSAAQDAAMQAALGQ